MYTGSMTDAQERFVCLMPADLKLAMTNQAAGTDRTVSQWVRDAIREKLDRDNGGPHRRPCQLVPGNFCESC